MTTAFVTGVGGQDGSYLAEELLAAGYAVHGLSAPGDRGHHTEGVVLHTADLRDTAAIGVLLQEIAPDQVYNLAGISSVAASWERPVETAEVNAVGALGLLEAARRVVETTGKRVAFVQAASAEVFGEPAETPQDEGTPIRPVNPYGMSKAFAHQAAAVYRTHGVHACSLILYNHESPRRPGGFVTRKITSTAAAIAQGRAVTIETVSEGPTPAGQMVFNLYAMDTAGARIIEAVVLPPLAGGCAHDVTIGLELVAQASTSGSEYSALPDVTPSPLQFFVGQNNASQPC